MAIYRDNSKRSQPLSAAGKKEEEKTAVPTAPAAKADAEAPAAQHELFAGAKRRKLPAERDSITHKFSIGGHEGYLTVGKYQDGLPGEIFIKMAKEGSTLSGIMDAFALSVSISLQPARSALSAAALPLRSLKPVPAQQNLFPGTQRRKLSAERDSITHKFSIGGHEGYLTVGKYSDGTPGEIFIKMAKEGSTLSGIMDAFALSVSISLQYGVPLRALVDKFVNSRFEPSGYTGNPKSATRSRSWTTSDGGSAGNSSRPIISTQVQQRWREKQALVSCYSPCKHPRRQVSR